jgi:hypothetical protein
VIHEPEKDMSSHLVSDIVIRKFVQSNGCVENAIDKQADVVVANLIDNPG